MELWSLMHFLMPQIFASHAQFKDWFNNPLVGMVEGQQEVNKVIIPQWYASQITICSNYVHSCYYIIYVCSTYCWLKYLPCWSSMRIFIVLHIEFACQVLGNCGNTTLNVPNTSLRS